MNLIKNTVKIIATFFYIGYLPFAGGTFASLAAVFLFLLIKAGALLCFFTTALILILGFWVSAKAEALFNKKDAPQIVIDEAAGMLLSLIFIPYRRPLFILLGFIFFRLFDILKPYPIGRLQQFKGSLGIMTDDLLAALYTNLVLLAFLKAGFF